MPRFDQVIKKSKVYDVSQYIMALRRGPSFAETPKGKPFDVTAIRKAAGDLTQTQFSDTYNINIATLKSWERLPERITPSSRAYLSLIAKAPKLVQDLLGSQENNHGETVDVRRLREQTLKMTRADFAYDYFMNESTLRGWERFPNKITSHTDAYLSLIEKNPHLIREASGFEQTGN